MALSLKEIVSSFNEILGSFLVQVSPIVGSSYASKFDLVTKMNSSLPIEQFMCHALEHEEQIMKRNEDYFKDTKNINQELKSDNVVMDEILRLQNIWTQLDANSKSNVWDIFQSMLYLGKEYIKIKYNLAN